MDRKEREARERAELMSQCTNSRERNSEIHGGWRQRLYIVIFESSTPMGKLFDVVLIWAIFISTFSVVLESDVEIRDSYGTYLIFVEWVFTLLFSIEYVLRIVCARNPLGYMRSFFGVVDLVSIVPTYLSLIFPGAQLLLVTRFIRLLRIFRVLKLVRYSQESRFLIRALMASRYKIVVFLGTVFIFILMLGTIMHLVEDGSPGFSSILGGMYWAIVTMTTVGYGDVVPLTGVGKFLASIIMIMGYGVIAVPTGIVGAEISSSLQRIPTVYCDCGARLYPPDAKFCHECGISRSRETSL